MTHFSPDWIINSQLGTDLRGLCDLITGVEVYINPWDQRWSIDVLFERSVDKDRASELYPLVHKIVSDRAAVTVPDYHISMIHVRLKCPYNNWIHNPGLQPQDKSVVGIGDVEPG